MKKKLEQLETKKKKLFLAKKMYICILYRPRIDKHLFILLVIHVFTLIELYTHLYGNENGNLPVCYIAMFFVQYSSNQIIQYNTNIR